MAAFGYNAYRYYINAEKRPVMSGQPTKAIKFGTDGWRAIIADSFTFDNVQLVVQSIVHYILEKHGTGKPVFIGYDGRFLGDKFAEKAAEVIRQNGLDVLMVKQYTPTPIVAFAAKHYDTAGALMFTASHNPPEYMGIKFIPEYAGPATPDITDKIVSGVEKLQSENWLPDHSLPLKGDFKKVDPTEAYIEFLTKNVNFDAIKKNPVKVLYDPMFGAGYGFLNRIFTEKAGYTPDMIHDRIDPRFGGRLPEPKDEYLPELIEQVVKDKYQLGIANDGDADRFGIIDEKGGYISNNFIMPLLLRYLYHHRGYRGCGVRTLATSTLMDALGDKLDFNVYETKVGFKHVGEIMRKEPVIVGGEESGGLSILHHIPEKDGILGALLVIEMMAVENKTITEIFKDTEKEANFFTHYVHENFYLTDEEKTSLMANMRNIKVGDTFAEREIKEIDTKDGVKLIFDQVKGNKKEWAGEWVLIRPSGTEPIIRLYGESQDEAFSAKFVETAKTYIKAPQAV